ncbi:MAG: SGNH/GDSL hydrolase family protein [Bacteroidales bacterium]|nr:SGNH/GDSL hydrolase family protein [Bacteroidales bacterium]
MKYKFLISAVLLGGLWSCQPEINEFEPSKGNADFTTYMTAGNSLTAGYADNALYKSAQENSFSKMLAEQMEFVGRQGSFKIPYINTEDGVGTGGGMLFTKLKMGFSTDCLGVTSLGPVRANPNATQQELAVLLGTPVADQGPFHNIGVPGAKVTHLLAPGYGSMNPYYGRFASAAGNAVIDEIALVKPTFFTLWIGNNDVLSYALAGGAADQITPLEGAPGVGFAASLEVVLMSFKATATAGAIANIPNITDIPYFTTVPFNIIALSDQAMVDQLNAGYAEYNGAMQQLGLDYRINFALGANPMVIHDPSILVPPGYEKLQIRQIKADELVLLSLPLDSIKCAYWGSLKPVPGAYVLDEKEITDIDNAVVGYNQAIKAAAEKYELAHVDMNAVLKQGSSGGIVMDGVSFSNTFVTGNAFSTDGVHLTPQGNALAANTFIDAINKKYNASIPKVNVAQYNAVVLP